MRLKERKRKKISEELEEKEIEEEGDMPVHEEYAKEKKVKWYKG